MVSSVSVIQTGLKVCCQQEHNGFSCGDKLDTC